MTCLAEIARTYLPYDGRVGVARQMVWKIKERGLQKLKHPARLKILLADYDTIAKSLSLLHGKLTRADLEEVIKENMNLEELIRGTR